ncbi:hypothetical protein TSAR_000718 [Trichomalopsis sarcophagae]|uniref:Uncharacterized protein n=1 Tax=Trichomalopsis sarcophagae TaxID=543379 RepID=A0A232FMU0_9HYME|nr:hypothetical protein TSAR_000718 [Trichomalopsis sarcophagae]
MERGMGFRGTALAGGYIIWAEWVVDVSCAMMSLIDVFFWRNLVWILNMNYTCLLGCDGFSLHQTKTLFQVMDCD